MGGGAFGINGGIAGRRPGRYALGLWLRPADHPAPDHRRTSPPGLRRLFSTREKIIINKCFYSRLAWLACLLLLAACSKAPSGPGAVSATAPGAAPTRVPFVRLANPLPTASPGKIEVVEFFSYGCPHCNHLEPILN